jgi:hypothetical protein
MPICVTATRVPGVARSYLLARRCLATESRRSAEIPEIGPGIPHRTTL